MSLIFIDFWNKDKFDDYYVIINLIEEKSEINKRLNKLKNDWIKIFCKKLKSAVQVELDRFQFKAVIIYTNNLYNEVENLIVKWDLFHGYR